MEQNLKQRLVGALVLISLAVIFLPLVFDGQQQRIDTAPYAIPDKPAITLIAPDVKPLEAAANEQYQAIATIEQARTDQDAQHETFDHTATTVDPVTASAVPSTPSASDTQQYLEQEKQVDASLKGQPVTTPAALAEAWVIQVGAFSSKPNAVGLQEKLKADGYPAFVRSAKASSGMLYKVYVGPEIRRAQLERQKSDLERKFKLKALILKYIP